jgi:hypothetical protein
MSKKRASRGGARSPGRHAGTPATPDARSSEETPVVAAKAPPRSSGDSEPPGAGITAPFLPFALQANSGVPARDTPKGDVPTEDDRLGLLRELYARGDVEGALVLAEELARRSRAPESPSDEYRLDDLASLPSSGGNQSDAPEMGMFQIDDSMSSLEPFPHDGPSSSRGGAPFEPPIEMSLQGLSGIIDDIESSEHTLEWRQPLSQRVLLMKQRLLAAQLGPVAPLISMLVDEPRPLPEVLTGEVPSPHASAKSVPAVQAQPPRPRRLPFNLTAIDRQRVPRVIIAPSEIGSLPLHPREGFVLAQVDGMQTIDEILDVCAMPAALAIEFLDQLEALGVIQID